MRSSPILPELNDSRLADYDPKNIETTENGICGFTNQESKPYFEPFETVIQSIADHVSLPCYSSLEYPQPCQGLYVRDDLILCKNIKKPFLLIEGPFQNNRSAFESIWAAQEAFEQTGVKTGLLGSLTAAITTSILQF